jgi:hypothetical protein
MALDLAAMLRKAIFETKTRLHGLEQALKHVIGSKEPTTQRPTRGKKVARSKGDTSGAKDEVSESQTKKAPRGKAVKTTKRTKRGKRARRKRGPAAKRGSGQSPTS